MKGISVKILVLSLIIICVPVFLSCSAENAKELYKTAEFEELQNNRDHANKLYTEILERYPESEYAEKAREKLSE
jgi:outer membrane protein assembly factor BamD (BamD/ComL family)